MLAFSASLAVPLACGSETPATDDDDVNEGGAGAGARGGGRGGNGGTTPAKGGEGGEDPGHGGTTTSGGTAAGGAPDEGGTSGGVTGGSGGTGGATGGNGGKGGSTSGGDSGSGGSSGGAAGTQGGAGSGEAGTVATGGSGGAGNAGSGGGGGLGNVLFQDDFESGSSAWTTHVAGNATWGLTTDGSTVYESANAAPSSTFHAASAGDLAWTDVRVEARVKIVSLTGASSSYFAGICARFQDLDNYQCLALRSDDRACIRSRYAGISDNSPVTPSGTVMVGTWYDLRIDAIGPVVTAYIDGVEIGTAPDYVLSGGIALASPGVNAVFDDVRVTVP